MASYEERVIRLIANPDNRAILTILDDASRPLSVASLADQLVSRDATVVDATTYDRRLDSMRLSLHHARLPRLNDAELAAYDPEQNVVSARDHAIIDPEWLEFDLLDEFLSRFGGKRGPDTIGILETEAAIYDYSRELADKADDELFIIYTSVDLLDEGCLPHTTRAIERGVDFYAGSQNPDVRRFFRNNVPETTIWEPQLDWMNEPSRYPRLNRLIVADREKVLLSLQEEPPSDGAATTDTETGSETETETATTHNTKNGSQTTIKPTETAMIGEGTTNPLVVLVRELLGPRLDHLDYQSDHFTGELPFEP
ncbi:DUF7344 domain-containing protein [Natrialba asiatica]|uniref:DUF7344 domain-containing protein n=1 Tax=Natrialba asiatica (strain ATCC 700177 / DSM 12278 / JCM 9576 / FERM P-10747 / NBRC 102637 / 172P1) TaxID=29540 RepID=M0AM01_NATA1|nr:hypothetical protein [Natrialba asiatica]ELY98413.1 hypothetical protein C481_17327 [Natrialba asiatica DSM 12278]